MKAPKILICRLAPLENMGVAATLIGLATGIRVFMPDAEIDVLSYVPDKYKNLEKYGVNLIQHPWWRPWGKLWPLSVAILMPYDFVRCALYRLLGKFIKRIKTPYDEYDVVIDNNTEHLKEELYSSRSVALSLLQTILAQVIFNKPLLTTPTSVGPFNTVINKWLAKQALNWVDLLALREESNYQYCIQLGIKKSKIHFVSDPSFLMEPAARERVRTILQQEGVTKTENPFIGFSPNWLEMTSFSFGESIRVADREMKYIHLMAMAIDHVINALNANVCFIPHVLGGLLSNKQNNDMDVCVRIYNEVKNKSKVVILKGDYMPDELKGIIGICNMFIGGRMHATIASTSLGIPTITIAYGDKYHSIIGDTMGQEEYIVDLRKQSFDGVLSELVLKIDALWENRENVSKILRDKASYTKRIALDYPKLLHDIVGNH